MQTFLAASFSLPLFFHVLLLLLSDFSAFLLLFVPPFLIRSVISTQYTICTSDFGISHLLSVYLVATLCTAWSTATPLLVFAFALCNMQMRFSSATFQIDFMTST